MVDNSTSTEKSLCNSSKENKTPARGALKAAAKPALALSLIHISHDPRATFVTMGKKFGMDEYALKEMVGHNIKDITESTYTVRDIEWLRKDIEKIK